MRVNGDRDKNVIDNFVTFEKIKIKCCVID